MFELEATGHFFKYYLSTLFYMGVIYIGKERYHTLESQY